MELQCDICEKYFKHKRELKRHKKQVHSKISEFICDICGREFTSKFSGLRHRKNKHKTLENPKPSSSKQNDEQSATSENDKNGILQVQPLIRHEDLLTESDDNLDTILASLDPELMIRLLIIGTR